VATVGDKMATGVSRQAASVSKTSFYQMSEIPLFRWSWGENGFTYEHMDTRFIMDKPRISYSHEQYRLIEFIMNQSESQR
jgi:hypothetical protein